MDKLVELPQSEWPKLRDLYKDKHMLPSSYHTIQNFIDWVKKKPESQVKILTLNGEWENDGTFVIKYETFVLTVFINTLADDVERLTRALNCLESDRPILFFGMPEHVIPAVEQHFCHLGIEKSKFQQGQTFWHHMPKEEALKFEVNPPEGITLRSLQVENADQINNNWPHKEPGSIAYTQDLIKYNLSVGAFDGNGDLVGWCLRMPMGSMSHLRAMDAHKRKGLGSSMVRYMAKNLALLGVDAMAPVVVDNTPSLTMFEKLGFKRISKAIWVHRPAKA